MELNAQNIRTLGIGFKTTFQNALKAASSMYPLIATEVSSSNQTEEYGWLRNFPRIREWIGDRQRFGMEVEEYQLRNKDWEGTLDVENGRRQKFRRE